MNRLLQATPQALNHNGTVTAHQGASRCLLQRRRAAAAAVCAQEPAAGGAAADSSNRDPADSSSSRRQQQDCRPSSSSSTGQPGGASARYPGGHQSRHSTAAADGGYAGYAAARPSSAACPEPVLSRSIQAATSWQELLSVLLAYSSAAQHKPAQQPLQLQQQQQQQQRDRQHQRQQQQQQRELQQEHALNAAVKQLNSKHLARLLKTLARLQPLQHSHGSRPAAAAAAAAASWSRQDQQQFWTLTQLAFSECMEQLPSLSAWEVSSTLWAASKLAQAPSPFLLRQLLQQLTQPGILAAASAQDISMSLHAVASLAVQVPEQQLDVLLSASAQHMQEAAPQALANTLWAVATLQHRPQEQWLRQLEAQCASILQASCSAVQQLRTDTSGSMRLDPQQQQQQQQQQRYEKDSFSAHGLYQLIWAMAKLQWQPTAAFQAGFWAASLSQLPAMSAHGVTGVLWAVASLALRPPEPWTAAWLSALQARMRQGVCGPQDMGNALWAVVRLRLRPDGEWVQEALTATHAVLKASGTQELSNILWSCAKLGVRPDAAWMHAWLSAMQARMGSYCAPALASSAYALAVLQYRPPRVWAHTLLVESQRQMPAFGAQELSNLVWALAVLGLQPGAAWFRDFEVQAKHESGSFNAQELSIIFWSLAKLRHTPPAPWVAGLLREGLEVAGGLQAQSLVLLLGALTHWDLPQMHTAGHYRVLLPRYWAAAEQLLPECSLDFLSSLYAARVKLGVLPSKQWSNSLLAAVHDRLQSSSAAAQEPLSVMASSSSSSSKVVSLLEQQRQQHATGTALKPAVVAELVLAAGKLWVQAPLPRGTLMLLLAAVTAVLPQGGWNLLTAVGMGLKHMRLGNRQLARSQAPRRNLATARGLSQLRGPLAAAAAPAAALARQQQQQRRPAGMAVSGRRCVARVGPRHKPAWAGVTSQELSQLVRPVWDEWFRRSTKLLLQAVTTAAADDVDVDQHRLAGSDAIVLTRQHGQQLLNRPAGSASKHIQQHQAKQVKGLLSCKDLTLQLRVVAALQLQPPAGWLAAVVAVAETQVSSSSAEALSWLLLDLVRVQQGKQGPSRVQLPEGFVMSVLRRAWVLHNRQQSTGLMQQQVLRLQSGMRRLREGGDVGDADWQQWQRLLSLWRANQGLPEGQ